MPDASPYLELAYGVFVLLVAIYVGIIAVRMRRTARERRALAAQLTEHEGVQPAAPAEERVHA